MKNIIFALLMIGMTTTVYAGKAIPLAEAAPVVKVTNSNLTDTAVTLSWITEKDGICQVNYGLSSGSLTSTAYDVRGSNTVRRIHFVTLTELNAATTYYYSISAAVQGTFTTIRSIIPSDSYLAYGRVYDRDKPSADTVVYLKLEDNDRTGSQGNSAIGSCLTDENGYWFYELMNLRTTDGNALFKFSQKGDFVYLDALAENGADVKTRMDTKDCVPARDVRMR